jgi:hypothetical protein
MAQNINEYYEELLKAYVSGEWYFAQNKDRAHNATIMRVMLEKATEIRMFCGEMSVFRKGFYRHIQKDNPELAQYLMDNVREALRGFLSRCDTRMTLILEEYNKEYWADTILPRSEFLNSLGFELLELPDYIGNKKSLSHITIADDERMVRLEVDKTTHEAVCKTGKTEGEFTPTNIFANLLKLAKPIPVAI